MLAPEAAPAAAAAAADAVTHPEVCELLSTPGIKKKKHLYTTNIELAL